MRPTEILKHTKHRPDAFPRRPWGAYQAWRNVIFLHWKISPALLLPYLPSDSHVTLDLFGENAWVSLVGFQVHHARPRYLPPIPFLSRFDELNLRTYVREANHSGVVFLNIDANRLLPVLLNKAAGLPYKFGKLSVKDGALRAGRQESIDIAWRRDPALLSKTPLDTWLTDRYYAIQQLGRKVYRYPIHHCSWPLHSVELQHAVVDYKWNTITLGSGIELAHYAPGVEALLWIPDQVKDV